MVRRKEFQGRRICLRKAPKDHTLLGICLMYCGTGYRGLQLQTHAPTHHTVEGVLIQAMKDIGLVEAIERGCVKGDTHHFARSCRTDRGVHAVRNIISLFVSNERLEALGDYDNLKVLLNNALPPTVRVAKVTLLMGNFIPRFFCNRRVYRYLIPAYALMAQCDTWENFHEKFPQSADSLRSHALAGSFFDLSPDETEPWRAALLNAVTRGNDLLQRFVVGTHRFHNFSVDLSHRGGSAWNRKVVSPSSNEAVRSVHRCEIVPRVFLLQKFRKGLTRAEYSTALEIGKRGASTSTSSLTNTVTTAVEVATKVEEDIENSVSDDSLLPFVVFQIEGNSFLFNMIRKIVGTLLAVLRGARETLFEEAMSSERRVVCPLAPGPYLYLFLSSYHRYDEAVRNSHSMRFHTIESEWRGDVVEAATMFAASSIAADIVDIDLNRTPALGTLLAARDAALCVSRPCIEEEDSHLAALKEYQPASVEPQPMCSEMTSFLRSLRVHNWSIEVLKPLTHVRLSNSRKNSNDDGSNNREKDSNESDSKDNNKWHNQAEKNETEIVEMSSLARKRAREEVSNVVSVDNVMLETRHNSGDNNGIMKDNDSDTDSYVEDDDGWIYVAPTPDAERCKRREYHRRRKERSRTWDYNSSKKWATRDEKSDAGGSE